MSHSKIIASLPANYKFPLAIVSPLLGARSETFIRRHIKELLPGNTVALYNHILEETFHEWNFHGPGLDISKIAPGEEASRFGQGVPQNLDYQFDNASRTIIDDFLHNHGVEVILCQYLDRSLPWIKVARDNGIRIYVHAHGYDVSRLLRKPIWRSQYLKLNDTDGIITVNTISNTRLVNIGIKPDLLHLIPCGVDVGPHTAQMERASEDKSHEIKCLAVGRMVGKKAPILLLDSFRRALERDPNMHLDYVGDGELMVSAIHYVEAHNLSDNVTLHGSKANSFVQSLMSMSDIFIHHAATNPVSGDEEGLPVAILEAMMHGLPVVSTYHAGIPDAVQNNLSGYIVQEGDVSTMANRIYDLAVDKDLRRKFGNQGKIIIDETYSWEIEKHKLKALMCL